MLHPQRRVEGYGPRNRLDRQDEVVEGSDFAQWLGHDV